MAPTPAFTFATPSALTPSSESKRMKTSPSSKHSTRVNFNLSNKTSLSDLAKRYNPTYGPGPTLQPAKKSSYSEKLDVPVRMELDHGTSHIVDVQRDLRFPFQYSTYCITERYPEVNVKSHPFISTFKLTAYDQLILIAYVLICYTYSREIPSYYTFKYNSETIRMDYLSKLMECFVPLHLESLLNSFAPTYDPQRKL
ncbi:hypothetical protein WA026_021773 [Henosepilachna vigintioctopunctata]|uniref:Uncharacterized protein n=1 Tax=Henosepilachna vigintioctopunctata TaxID=420089 RepID=A0AAW1U1N2_9CUCU